MSRIFLKPYTKWFMGPHPLPILTTDLDRFGENTSLHIAASYVMWFRAHKKFCKE